MKCTEVCNILYSSFKYLAFFKLAHDLCTLCFNITFNKCFVRYNSVLNSFIDLNNLKLHCFTHKLIIICYWLHINL